jgi:CMP-N-acetylneuraminic acid synthetase
MKFLFFIPARGGSKGIVDKNLQLIGENSLAAITVDFLCEAGFQEFTVLSSDSDKILQTCRAKGILCDKRPKAFSADETTTAATIKEFIESGRGNYNLDQDDWVIIAEPTSPFRRLGTLDVLLDVIGSNKFDSIFTVYKSSAVEWIEGGDFWNRKDNVDGSQSRRQARPPKYHECGVFYATQVKNITSASIMGKKCHCLVVDSTEALDINSPLDLEVCRTIFNQLNET